MSSVYDVKSLDELRAMDEAAARVHLDRYLTTAARELAQLPERFDLTEPLDFNLATLSALLNATKRYVKLEARPEPVALVLANPNDPDDRIKFSHDLDLDEATTDLAYTFGYYLGESFTRAYPTVLRWDTAKGGGNHWFNLPVVAGFVRGTEMAVTMIVRNIYARAAEAEGAEMTSVSFTKPDRWSGSNPKNSDDFADLVKAWQANLPVGVVTS